MTSLIDYVSMHAVRGECKCGLCIDSDPSAPDPEGHTVDLVFFKVALRQDVAERPTADRFREFTTRHVGVFTDCDPFDGKEHGYMELGGWIGDQSAALLYMGLGSLLGVFHLLSPKTVIGGNIPDDVAMSLAQAGYVTIRAKRERM